MLKASVALLISRSCCPALRNPAPPHTKTRDAYYSSLPPRGHLLLAPLTRHTTQHRRQCRCTISPLRLENLSPYRTHGGIGTANCSSSEERGIRGWIDAWVFFCLELDPTQHVGDVSQASCSSIHGNHLPSSRVCTLVVLCTMHKIITPLFLTACLAHHLFAPRVHG